jgi:hypothetical protein
MFLHINNLKKINVHKDGAERAHVQQVIDVRDGNAPPVQRVELRRHHFEFAARNERLGGPHRDLDVAFRKNVDDAAAHQQVQVAVFVHPPGFLVFRRALDGKVVENERLVPERDGIFVLVKKDLARQKVVDARLDAVDGVGFDFTEQPEEFRHVLSKQVLQVDAHRQFGDGGLRELRVGLVQFAELVGGIRRGVLVRVQRQRLFVVGALDFLRGRASADLQDFPRLFHLLGFKTRVLYPFFLNGLAGAAQQNAHRRRLEPARLQIGKHEADEARINNVNLGAVLDEVGVVDDRLKHKRLGQRKLFRVLRVQVLVVARQEHGRVLQPLPQPRNVQSPPVRGLELHENRVEAARPRPHVGRSPRRRKRKVVEEVRQRQPRVPVKPFDESVILRGELVVVDGVLGRRALDLGRHPPLQVLLVAGAAHENVAHRARKNAANVGVFVVRINGKALNVARKELLHVGQVFVLAQKEEGLVVGGQEAQRPHHVEVVPQPVVAHKVRVHTFCFYSFRMDMAAIPVSVGEVWDKSSILLIKMQKIKDESKLVHVRYELSQLPALDFQHPLFQELRRVNERLWEVEDALRVKEARKEFDAEFIELARAVYITNDRRAEIKKQINEDFHSPIHEVKDYVAY